jgi:hypothetical protein
MDGSPADQALFFAVDGIQGTAEYLVTPCLYLGEYQDVAIAADQIHLPTAGCTEVPPENFPTKAPQVEYRLILTPAPEGDVGGRLRTRRRVGRPVQNRADDAGKVHDRGV